MSNHIEREKPVYYFGTHVVYISDSFEQKQHLTQSTELQNLYVPKTAENITFDQTVSMG